MHGNGRAERPRLDRAGTGFVLRVGDDDDFTRGGLRYPGRPNEHWPEWFPVIKTEGVLGPRREGVGMRRVATIPGGKVEELIIAWDPGQRFAFTATAVSPGIVRALLEDCRIEHAHSGTRVTYTM